MAIRKPGPYAPLSAHYYDDERVTQAGEKAELLYCRMLAYAARTPLTEGWIPATVVLGRLGFKDVEPRIRGLIGASLVSEVDDGYQIVSWLRWNKSAEEMGRERGRDRIRKARDQELSGTSAGNDTGKTTGTSAELPSPFPLAETNTSTSTSTSTPSRDTRDDEFDHFWSVYPRRVAKPAAIRAWKAAAKKADPETVIAAAKRYAGNVGDPKFTPHPATWLNQERWNDEPTPTAQTQTAERDDDYYRNLPKAADQWSR